MPGFWPVAGGTDLNDLWCDCQLVPSTLPVEYRPVCFGCGIAWWCELWSCVPVGSPTLVRLGLWIRCWYGGGFQLLIYHAARRCTISTALMLCAVWGSQTVETYSRVGRTKVLYACSLESWLYMSEECAFLVTSTWVFQDNDLLIVTTGTWRCWRAENGGRGWSNQTGWDFCGSSWWSLRISLDGIASVFFPPLRWDFIISTTTTIWHTNSTNEMDFVTLTLTLMLKIAFTTLLPPGAWYFTNTYFWISIQFIVLWGEVWLVGWLF